MPIDILMPALSPTMTEGNLAKWLKKEGDSVEAGDIIAEVETDKATMEVESIEDGTLSKILVQEGTQSVPINSLIAILVTKDEKDIDIDEYIKTHKNFTKTKNIESTVSNDISINDTDHTKTKPSEVEELDIKNNQIQNDITQSRIFASPLARRIAKMENIDLRNIVGTGPSGRIIKSDVMNIIQQVSKRHDNVQPIRNKEEFTLIPNSNMRKIIAQKLCESKKTIPHFYLSIDCDIDDLIRTREEINKSFEKESSVKLSLNDFVIMASAKALSDVPKINASWNNDTIMSYNNVDVSVAVAVDDGLITPIIKNADQKDIISISQEMKNLIKKAKANRLKPEEFQGGGFSISNLGMYNITNFQAIINPPQSCILAVGKGVQKPSVINNKITISTIMNVSLSCDHRVVDGAIASNFLSVFKKYIESPILLFI